MNNIRSFYSLKKRKITSQYSSIYFVNVPKAAFILISSFFIFYSSGANATQNKVPHPLALVSNIPFSEQDLLPEKIVQSTQPDSFKTGTEYYINELNGTNTQPNNHQNTNSLLWLFLQSFIAGILAVFTPYIYTIHPFTTGYLSRNVKSGNQKIINSLIYAFSIIAVFTLLGIVISVIIKLTGLQKFTDHWVFNLLFFRIFITLGISFLGAFSIKLPASWINAMANQAKTNNFKGIFFMAITLPGASFSSTFPIIGIVLVLACNVSIVGPAIGLFGFATGLALPFVFPGLLNMFIKSKSLLNNIKIVMGFFSLMIALKFLSKADISLGYNLLDRDLFIEIWMALWAFMGVYMLGLIKLSNDTETEQNIYGQEYIPLSRLFISIISFVFALYLLPGIWGAPLHGINSFLPQTMP